MLSIIDRLTDPVTHHYPDNMYRMESFVIQIPLTKVDLEYYDWMTGNVITYDEFVAQGKNTRWRCIMKETNDSDYYALLVDSVNVWIDEGVVQMEIKHLVDMDVYVFIPYMKLKKMWRHPDRVHAYR